MPVKSHGGRQDAMSTKKEKEEELLEVRDIKV
ncbi:hypothetical protein EDC39_103261 [Geothermobacter ehrlichii]|uniref:Uncharacterized protein n=1 Tax=Geothermobacter ehrlichii TaxID=213224 RepID=A0A5D3WKB9_9BACT|nr:hypothetical protein EDC39_103261 [Geothermobacter ehrlichii]